MTWRECYAGIEARRLRRLVRLVPAASWDSRLWRSWERRRPAALQAFSPEQKGRRTAASLRAAGGGQSTRKQSDRASAARSAESNEREANPSESQRDTMSATKELLQCASLVESSWPRLLPSLPLPRPAAHRVSRRRGADGARPRPRRVRRRADCRASALSGHRGADYRRRAARADRESAEADGRAEDRRDLPGAGVELSISPNMRWGQSERTFGSSFRRRVSWRTSARV